jgi:hypothetical protein
MGAHESGKERVSYFGGSPIVSFIRKVFIQSSICLTILMVNQMEFATSIYVMLLLLPSYTYVAHSLGANS